MKDFKKEKAEVKVEELEKPIHSESYPDYTDYLKAKKEGKIK